MKMDVICGSLIDHATTPWKPRPTQRLSIEWVCTARVEIQTSLPKHTLDDRSFFLGHYDLPKRPSLPVLGRRAPEFDIFHPDFSSNRITTMGSDFSKINLLDIEFAVTSVSSASPPRRTFATNYSHNHQKPEKSVRQCRDRRAIRKARLILWSKHTTPFRLRNGAIKCLTLSGDGNGPIREPFLPS